MTDQRPRKLMLQERAQAMKEFLDTTPVEIPAKYQQPETLEDRLKRLVRNEMSRAAQDSGQGSFDEEDDFSLDDEDDLPELSDYQVKVLMEEYDAEVGSGVVDDPKPIDPAELGLEQKDPVVEAKLEQAVQPVIKVDPGQPE